MGFECRQVYVRTCSVSGTSVSAPRMATRLAMVLGSVSRISLPQATPWAIMVLAKGE